MYEAGEGNRNTTVGGLRCPVVDRQEVDSVLAAGGMLADDSTVRAAGKLRAVDMLSS